MKASILSIQSLMAILLILLVGTLVYSNTFQVPFVFDDEISISQNSAIRNIDIFDPANAEEAFLPPNRNVVYWSFAVNYHFGALNVGGYHFVNLAIHLLAALVVYALLRMTFRTPYVQSRVPGLTGRGSWSVLAAPDGFVPLFAALLFVAHPLQTQAVTYVVQRTTSLATLFYLLSLALYAQARLLLESRKGTPLRMAPVLLLAGGVISAVLAMQTKEIAFTLPFAVLLYEFSFFRGSWKRRLLYAAPILATLPIIPLTLLDLDGSAGDVLSESADKLRVGSSMPRLYYLLTQFRVLVTYLRLLVLPVNQNLDYDYPVYRDFFAPEVVLSFLLLTALVFLALYLFYRSRSSEPLRESVASGDPLLQDVSDLPGKASPIPTVIYWRLTAFGISWFFLTLAVESSLVPIIDVIMEHRLYLPMFGAATVFSSLFPLLLTRMAGPFSGKVVIPLALIILTALGAVAYQRNQVWGDKVGLWQDVVAKSPNKGRSLNNLGTALEGAGRREDAIQVLSRSVQVDPGYFKSYYNLADLHLVSDRPEMALPLLQTAIRLNPGFTEAYVATGAALMRSGRFREVAMFLEQNLNRVGENPEARFYLGSAYVFLGDRQAALRELEIVSRGDRALAANLAAMLGLRSQGGSPHGRN